MTIISNRLTTRSVLVAAVCFVAIEHVATAGLFGTCAPDATQDSGAIYRICMPNGNNWNGDLIVFAHGYVDVTQPIAIPEGQLSIEGIDVPEIANLLGYAFAVSSYSTNGLAIPEGLDDSVDLVDIFTDLHGEPNRIYLIGPSEGGSVTTLGLELHPDVFDGGLSMCGPTGSFQGQVNFIGDFRVLFDYYFPGVLPGDATEIPQELIDHWSADYLPAIRDAIWADVPSTLELITVSGAAIDVFDVDSIPQSIENTIIGLLWYNAFGTNDATDKLGGFPYDNSDRVYAGSSDDATLNQDIPRFSADPVAVQAIADHYQPSGLLTIPQVALHTIGDEIIPWWQAVIYLIRTIILETSDHNFLIPAPRYGHCNFTVEEVVISFAIMVQQVTGEPLSTLDSALQQVDRDAAWPMNNPIRARLKQHPTLTPELRERIAAIRKRLRSSWLVPELNGDEPAAPDRKSMTRDRR